GPNIVLNTIIADTISEMCDELEKAGKNNFNDAVQKLLQKIIKQHKRVIYNGDNYTEAWVKEAAKRGLPNMTTTPEALEVLAQPEVTKLFGRQGVLTAAEVKSRYEIYKETYNSIIKYESDLAVDMVKTSILPAAIDYQASLADSIKTAESVIKTPKQASSRKALATVSAQIEAVYKNLEKLEKATSGSVAIKMKNAMDDLRVEVDKLEALVPADVWPLPSYAEMLFVL
ncbi:MAG: glutamine synthetase type III, partial [Candidatus Omnitrophica bacterium]|nr:glutamine synthetase type III [Candidatus Omnitrophota bacterium]